MIKTEFYCILLAIAVFLDWDIEQVDIDTAFLYGDIDNEIFVEILYGNFADLSDRTIIIYRLLKSLYGVKQALKIWFDTLRKALKEIRFKRLDTEYSVYVLLQR